MRRHLFLMPLYNSVAVLASLFCGPLFYFNKRGRERLSERFGSWDMRNGPEASEKIVWLHGASAGEVKGLMPLVPYFRKHFPESRILLTVTSTTGLTQVKEGVDEARLLPFDASPWIQRATEGLTIEALIIGETELWPALFNFMAQRKVPIFCVNARISDATVSRYQRLRWFFRPLLRSVKKVCLADAASRDRFERLGVASEKLVVTGNAKYDAPPKVQSVLASQELRKRFFADDLPILVLGSIHPGEEQFWFTALQESAGSGERCNVVVAPRHREKFDFFAQKLQDFGFEYERWSAIRDADEQPKKGNHIVLLDTYGDLEGTYSFADFAFIGASIVNIGGHNPLEAAAYGVPIAMGTNVFVVADIVQDLFEANGLVTVRNLEDVDKVLDIVLHNPAEGKAMGANAREVYECHVGATQRIVDELDTILSKDNVLRSDHELQRHAPETVHRDRACDRG